MSVGYDSSGLRPGAHAYIRCNIDAISSLKPPDARWTRFDVAEAARSHLERLRIEGAIEVTGSTEGRHVYVTTEAAWEVIQDYDKNRNKLLCDHGGFRNIGGGLFTCGHEDCDHRYTRDTLELLLSDE